MVVSIWLFKILASYCNSKLANAVNCLVLWLLSDKTRLFAISWWCRQRQGCGTVMDCFPAALLINFPLSASVCLSVGRPLLSVLCPVHKALPNPSSWALPHFCPAVGETWMSPVLITWEEARKIPWPEGGLGTLGDLGGLSLARFGELAPCAASWWSWSQGGQWGWRPCISRPDGQLR